MIKDLIEGIVCDIKKDGGWSAFFLITLTLVFLLLGLTKSGFIPLMLGILGLCGMIGYVIAKVAYMFFERMNKKEEKQCF
jgi:hypothetical protein